MRDVEVKVTSADKNDQAVVRVHVETKRGDVLARTDGKDLVVNRDVAKFSLHPNQRLVVEAFPQEEPVYDRGQGAAILSSQQKNEKNSADSPDKTAKPSAVLAQEKGRLDKETAKQPGSTPPNSGTESASHSASTGQKESNK